VQTTTRGIPFHTFGARAWVVLACVVCSGLPIFANTDQVFQKTYPLPSGGQFLLDNVNGSVQVEGWDRDEVEVEAVKSSNTSTGDTHDLDAVKIEVESDPGKVNVHTLYPDGQGLEVAVEYHIHVPNHVLLGSVRTVNGSLLVRGVEGSGELKSVNGNVEVLESSGRFNAQTTNGNLRLEFRHLKHGAPMKLETVNGSVVLGLPSNASADLNLRNMNGDLYSEFPVTSTSDLPGARAYRGKVGHGGGGSISVRTVNGGIRLLVEHPGV
jgi:hypothetical protein